MTAYVIVDIALRDESHQDAFRAYAAETNRLLAENGVRVIAFDPTPGLLEGDWRPHTIVVQKYADRAAVERFQNSSEYAPLKALRQRIADTSVIVVDGT